MGRVTDLISGFRAQYTRPKNQIKSLDLLSIAES
jgi:hypothetical protein